jgi:glycosyltransferase involved in cell wall biosynthesis
MKTLVIANKSPFPVIDGGCFAMNVFLKNLQAISEIEQIDYFVLSTHKHPFTESSIPLNLKEKTKFHSLEIDTKLYTKSALGHLIQGKSYNLSRFFDAKVDQKIETLIHENQYDCIIFESLFPLVYLETIRKISKAKCILRSHNIEHEIWDDLQLNERNPLKKWYLNQLVKALKKEEVVYYKQLDLILSLSNDDIEKIEKLCSTPTRFIPVSIENTTCKTDYTSNSLCFIGAFNWEPNVEAIKWFLRDLNPSIQKSTPVQVVIAGKDGATVFKDNSSTSIQFKGFVENPSEFLKSNGIFIAPMKSGSGVKIKVLEALSNGLPCVLTPKSAEGLDLPPTYPICKTNQEFINLCIDLAINSEKREQLGKLGFEFIEANFGFESVVGKLKTSLIGN